MTRKPLPRAIQRSDADLRLVGADADMEAPLPARAALDERAEAQPSVALQMPVAKTPLPAAFSITQAEAEQRLRDAFKIVERHKFYAGLGGLFPLAFVNVASITLINLRMVKLLTDLYQVPFDRDRTRSVVLGLMGGAAPTGLAAVTNSTLAFVIPGAVAPGIAVSSLTAAAMTRGIGMFFLDRLEKGLAG